MELGIRRRYVLDVTLNNLYTQHFGVEHRLFLEKLAGESIQHVVMKLLTWLITYRPGLEIEMPIGEHYKPDLVRRDEAFQVTQWADCGQTSLTKLDAIVARHRAPERRPRDHRQRHGTKSVEPNPHHRMPPPWLEATQRERPVRRKVHREAGQT